MARKTKQDGPKFDGPEDRALREWLRLGLQKPGKTQKGLARAMGRSESVVSRLLSGDRRLQFGELPAVSRYIEEEPPSTNHAGASVVSLQPNNKAPRTQLGSEQTVPPPIRVTAIIAPGVWREAGISVAIAERVPASPDPRVQGLKQYACKIEADGRFVICVPYGEMRPKPLAGDTVHVRRFENGRYEDTVRVVRIVRDQVQLEQVNGNNKPAGRGTAIAYPPAKDDGSVEIRGLVVGYYSPASF